MGTRRAIREGMREGGEALVAAAGPGLVEAGRRVGVALARSILELRRAALVYELRYVEELCTALWEEWNQLGGPHPPSSAEERCAMLKEKLELLGDRAEKIRAELWPEVYDRD